MGRNSGRDTWRRRRTRTKGTTGGGGGGGGWAESAIMNVEESSTETEGRPSTPGGQDTRHWRPTPAPRGTSADDSTACSDERPRHMAIRSASHPSSKSAEDDTERQNSGEEEEEEEEEGGNDCWARPSARDGAKPRENVLSNAT